jgi:uncharacterized protein
MTRARAPRRAALLCALLALAAAPWAAAQQFDFRAPPNADDMAALSAMRDLAGRVLPVYQENDSARYLSYLSALQMVAGDYASADATRQTLRPRRSATDPSWPLGQAILYDVYAHARNLEASDKLSFADAFTRSFRDMIGTMNDADAYAVTAWRGPPVARLQEAVQRALDQYRNQSSVSLQEAVDLIWAYFSFEAYRSISKLVDGLDSEDDRRRYSFDDHIFIKSADGTRLSALLVRPRNAPKSLPTLLEFTIYSDAANYARECAAHGYAGVVAYSRGKPAPADALAPYQLDGDDARSVINWIAKQPWSDGRVGMYGSNYSGFTAWAAAKRLPAALKAIATADTTAPGINVPMDGSIFQSSAYRWALAVTDLVGASSDEGHWQKVNEDWYRSGKSFQHYDRFGGRENRFFHRWMNHPSYDLFWQRMIPFGPQFRGIDIPVLAVTGYYAAGEGGVLYYWRQQHRYRPDADQTLLIGPYADGATQYGVPDTLWGYQIDATAQIGLRELRYQWFDSIFKGAPRPALLSDRVNYEVMGANEWQHAASLEAMANASVRFYLDARSSANGRVLAQSRGAAGSFTPQDVNFADRSDAAWTPSAALTARALADHDSVTFVSEPLSQPLEFNGLFSGRLDFSINKMDADLNLQLYELLPSGDYVRLFAPAYAFRASYAGDRSHRRLLKAGERQQLSFSSERISSRKLQSGSRLVLVLGVNKRADREINYGSGNNVSEESIDDSDGKTPLRIRWYSDSYLDLPVRN